MTASSDLEALEARLSADIEAASDLAALDALRVGALGKKGEVSLKMRELGKMSPEERQVMGPALNGLKDRLNALLESRKTTMEDAALNAALASESVDVTRPVKREAQGSLARRLHRLASVGRVHDDAAAVMQTARQARAELETLFDADRIEVNSVQDAVAGATQTPDADGSQRQ